MFFFPPRYTGLGGRRRGERDQKKIWKCFFHCGVAREGFIEDYFFFKIHHGTGERVHRGFRVQLDFFSSFFYC